MKLLLPFIACLIFSTTLLGQSTSGYYYYAGQSTAIALSEKVMFVKFVPGLSNTQKQNLITQAQVDLMMGDWNSINDLVQLKSRVLQRQVLYYPCGTAEAKTQNFLNKPKPRSDSKIAPCDGCPPQKLRSILYYRDL